MSEVPSASAESKGAGRKFPRWRRLLLGIASLFIVYSLAYLIWLSGQPRGWLLVDDRASLARISKAIEADPRRFLNTRLCDVIRELDLEDVPWDNVMNQEEDGTGRYYHFRGFTVYVSIHGPSENWQYGKEQRMFREEGSPEEKRQVREALRIISGPRILIDGIRTREVRMSRYEEMIREINEKMDLRRHSPP